MGLDKVRTWWRAHRPSTRALVQLYAALLYNAHLKGFVQGEIFTGPTKALCVPGLNCYSCPGAVGACPLGALQNALASAGHGAGWYVLGVLALFGLALGRTVCGWLCPMGLLQELLHGIPTPKLGKGRVTRALSWVKYAVLAVLVVALPLGYGLRHGMPLPAFCKYLCPAGTLEGAVGLLSNPANGGLFAMLGLAFTRKFVALVLIALACVFCWRAFCRFLCPLGALYGLFNRVALIGVKVDADRCNGCGACVRRCPMDARRVGDRECISCGKCVDACARGAIALCAGRAVLSGPKPAAERPRRARRAVRAAALMALVAALVAFNLPGAPKQAAPEAAVGSAVGEQLADFTLPLLDGTTFRLSEHRGQVVFINLWATYCAPCVREMPCFDRLKAGHPEIEVLAVHSSLVTEDVAAYLADKGWALDFAVDEGDAALQAIDGSALLPQTVVLDGDGVVVYNQAGSVSDEILEELLARASGAPPA